MRAAVVLALGGLLFTGPAVAECATSPVTNISAGAGAGKDQKIWSYHTNNGWSHIIESMPSWMRAQRASRRGYDIIDIWGIPRAGTYRVSVRYTNAQKSVVCDSNLRIK